jgi:putative oxidoreductase
MIDPATALYAALLVRLCLRAMFIAHALLKWRVFAIPGTITYFQRLGCTAGDGALVLLASPL